MEEFMEMFQKIPGLNLFIKFHNERWIVSVTHKNTNAEDKHGDKEAAYGMDYDREKAFEMALKSLNNYVKGEIFK